MFTNRADDKRKKTGQFRPVSRKSSALVLTLFRSSQRLRLIDVKRRLFEQVDIVNMRKDAVIGFLLVEEKAAQ